MIYCFGDSHVSFFSGRDAIQPVVPGSSDDLLPFFRTFHVGPALAYNLIKEGTQTRGREKVLETLAEKVPPGSRVLLCFGEIDCRSHLLRHVWKENASMESVALTCAEHYTRFASELQEKGYEPIVYNAVPSRHENTRRDKWDKADYPSIGTHLERNKITALFNQSAEKICQDKQIHFLSNYPALITSSGKTRQQFYMDRIHLSQRAMPLTLERLAGIYPSENFSLPALWKAPKLRRVFSFTWPFFWYETSRDERC